MSAWEAMPVLDIVIKEVLRLTISGTTLRRVLQPGVVINGYEIPVGSFLCHPLGTESPRSPLLSPSSQLDPAHNVSGLTHLDEKIFSNPHVFDPDRFLPPRSEESVEAYSFLGWGVGTIRLLPQDPPIVCLILFRLGSKAPVPRNEVGEAGDEEHPGCVAHFLRISVGGEWWRAASAGPQQSPHHQTQGPRRHVL